MPLFAQKGLKGADSTAEEQARDEKQRKQERKQQKQLPRPPPPSTPPPPPPLVALLPPDAPFPASALADRDEGNAAMAAGDASTAVIAYSRALLQLQREEEEEEEEKDENGNVDVDGEEKEKEKKRTGGKNEEKNHRHHLDLARALLLSNRAAARLSLRHFAKASADSLESLRLCGGVWWRPWVRLARARAGAGDAAGAAGACREGMAAVASSLMSLPSTSSTTANAPILLPTKGRIAAQAVLRAEADYIALSFAMEGIYDGFDGAVLEVRPAEAGSEWLGLPAPRDPQIDSDDDYGGEEDEHVSARRICSGKSSNGKKALVLASSSPSSSSSRAPSKKKKKKKSSFRSLHDALDAAEDGDVIRLLPGTHNGMGRSAVIEKRVLIDGRAATTAAAATATTTTMTATLDARGNVPALRFRRPAAVVGLSVDASGFREAVRVDPLAVDSWGGVGGRVGREGREEKMTTRALLADCLVSCSGDDGVVVAGAPPTTSFSSSSSSPSPVACLSMIRCSITAKKAGVRSFLGGDVEMVDCRVERCGAHGVAAVAVSPSSAFLPSCHSSSSSSCSSSSSSYPPLDLGGKIAAVRCRISRCLEEGALVSGPGAELVLDGCDVSACGGPAVDASGARCLVVVRGGGGSGCRSGSNGTEFSRCRLTGSSGGLWLWDGARARVIGVGGGGGGFFSSEDDENDSNNNGDNNNATGANGVLISSRSTYALLTDGKGTKLSMEGCDVRGGVRGDEAASALASRKNNSYRCCSSSAPDDNDDNDDDENEEEEEETNVDENSSPRGSASSSSRRPPPARHCGPPPAVGPFRWDGPDPLRVE